MKKLTAVILLLSMLGTSLVACSDSTANGDDTQTGTTNTTSADAEVAEEEETELTDGLPDTKMNGFELNILHHSQEWLSWANNVLEAEEQTGEILNDAIYNRRVDLEERFDASIVTEAISDVSANIISQLVLAGESTYDLCLMYDLRITGAIQYLADMSELPYVSLDEAWWSPDASSIFVIGGKQYAACGNYSLSALSRAGGYAFNADIVNEFALTSPYEYVKNNEWTIDNMYVMADAVTIDIDGDGQMTNADQFGIEGSIKEHFLRMLFGSEIPLIIQDGDGYPLFNLPYDEVAVTKMQHILDLSSNGGWYVGTNTNVDNGDSVTSGTFQNGRCLFNVSNPHSLASIRDYDFNVGFVPVPKYDETQEKYYAPSFGAELSVLPMSYDATAAENIGILLEAMAFYTKKNIVPEYTETLIKSKYARDEESAEMLTICFDNLYFDFGINAWQEQVAAKLLSGSFVGLAGNFGSVLKSMEKSVQSEIKKLTKQIDNAG